MEWERVPFPPDLEILIVDTGVRRALRDGSYAERRRECERGLETSRAQLERPIESLSDLSLGDLPALRASLPLPLYRRVRHVVTENERVRVLVRALGAGDRSGAGDALYGSHASLRDDYEVTCPESDLLVDQSPTLPGVLGARMTGAGWGGCTVHLVETRSADDVLTSLEQRFADRFGRTPRVWRTRPGGGAHVAP
jgi:galactokinase